MDAIDYGFKPGDKDFDNSLVLNKAIEEHVEYLHFPAGTYFFNTQPNKIFHPIRLEGNGINNTAFLRNFSSNDVNSALIHTFSTIICEKFSINCADGTTGGGGIRAEGLGASSSVFRDLYITGGYNATYQIPLCLYSNDPMGIRTCVIDNVCLFSATVHLAWLVNVKGLSCFVNAYPAGGTVGHVTIQGSGTIRPSNILYRTTYTDTLYLYNTDNLTLEGLGTTNIIKSGCNNIRNLA